MAMRKLGFEVGGHVLLAGGGGWANVPHQLGHALCIEQSKCTCRLGCCLDYRSLCVAISFAIGCMQTFHGVIHILGWLVCLYGRAVGVQGVVLICSSITGAMLLGQTQVPRLVCLGSMSLAREPS